MNAALLKELGFEKVSGEIDRANEFKRKLAIAIEHYRYVTSANITAFNDKLKKETLKDNGKKPSDVVYYQATWQTLKFADIKTTDQIPPEEVLIKMKEAKDLGCFDTFEIAHIDKVEVKDPILFGCINGTDKKFFIGQWDDDVKIEDIISEKEG